VQQRDEEGQHAEVASIVEQRQEAAIEPRQRPDRKDDCEHEKGAGAERTDAHIDRGRLVLGRVEPIPQNDVRADIERHGREQDGVVDELRLVPLHRAKAGAHGLTSSAAGGAPASGGGRSVNAITKPIAIAKARMGQIAR
jgi:hypothetical protein